MTYKHYIPDDDDYYNDDNLNEFSDYEMEDVVAVNRMALQILDSRGHVEDILFELEDIYNYVVNVYKNSPKGN